VWHYLLPSLVDTKSFVVCKHSQLINNPVRKLVYKEKEEERSNHAALWHSTQDSL